MIYGFPNEDGLINLYSIPEPNKEISGKIRKAKSMYSLHGMERGQLNFQTWPLAWTTKSGSVRCVLGIFEVLLQIGWKWSGICTANCKCVFSSTCEETPQEMFWWKFHMITFDFFLIRPTLPSKRAVKVSPKIFLVTFKPVLSSNLAWYSEAQRSSGRKKRDSSSMVLNW